MIEKEDCKLPEIYRLSNGLLVNNTTPIREKFSRVGVPLNYPYKLNEYSKKFSGISSFVL